MYRAVRLLAEASGADPAKVADLPDIEPLGSGWLDDILMLDGERVKKQNDILKMSGEGALKYSLLNG